MIQCVKSWKWYAAHARNCCSDHRSGPISSLDFRRTNDQVNMQPACQSWDRACCRTGLAVLGKCTLTWLLLLNCLGLHNQRPERQVPPQEGRTYKFFDPLAFFHLLLTFASAPSSALLLSTTLPPRSRNNRNPDASPHLHDEIRPHPRRLARGRQHQPGLHQKDSHYRQGGSCTSI